MQKHPRCLRCFSHVGQLDRSSGLDPAWVILLSFTKAGGVSSETQAVLQPSQHQRGDSGLPKGRVSRGQQLMSCRGTACLSSPFPVFLRAFSCSRSIVLFVLRAQFAFLVPEQSRTASFSTLKLEPEVTLSPKPRGPLQCPSA